MKQDFFLRYPFIDIFLFEDSKGQGDILCGHSQKVFRY